MSESIIGIQKCGCITFALVDGEHVRREDERAMAKIVRNGGRVERMDDEVIRSNPDFMPWECPHNPKGWEPSVPRSRRR